jgi:hypothetical protein
VDIPLPDGIGAAGAECTDFGQATSAAIGFNAHNDGGPAGGRLTLGPWSAGVVRFLDTKFPAPN